VAPEVGEKLGFPEHEVAVAKEHGDRGGDPHGGELGGGGRASMGNERHGSMKL
jgi:hypothetical protein